MDNQTKIIRALAKMHQEQIKIDFQNEIEHWTEFYQDDQGLSRYTANDWAVEHISNLKNEDFFEILSKPLIKVFDYFMDVNPFTVRAVIGSSFDDVARDNYKYPTQWL